MKLVSVGIDPYHVGLTTDHVSAELFGTLIKCPLFYIYSTRILYIFNTYNPTRKKKLVSVGIDPQHIGSINRPRFAELFDL